MDSGGGPTSCCQSLGVARILCAARTASQSVAVPTVNQEPTLFRRATSTGRSGFGLRLVRRRGLVPSPSASTRASACSALRDYVDISFCHGDETRFHGANRRAQILCAAHSRAKGRAPSPRSLPFAQPPEEPGPTSPQIRAASRRFPPLPVSKQWAGRSTLDCAQDLRGVPATQYTRPRSSQRARPTPTGLVPSTGAGPSAS